MKVKVLSRNPDDYLRETSRDIFKVPRCYKPALHPFETPREYVRALNATKLERVFAKPFLGSLDGHTDSINCLCKSPTSLSTLLSGSASGEVIVWDLSRRCSLRSINAHSGHIRGLCVSPTGGHFYSIGDDRLIKQWAVETTATDSNHGNTEPLNTIVGKTIYLSIDHHQRQGQFVTSGQKVDIWDESRAEPIRSFDWGAESVHCVRFNPVETDIVASCAQDRNIVLYDIRKSVPLRKVLLNMKTNMVAWNPMEAFSFTAANEDYHLYTFDMRYLKKPRAIHYGHVSAVLDVDFSPTGREFVTASFDKTIRIFPSDKGNSRDVYHTKRMQRVSSVAWSLDDRYILSGSEEMCVRIWKARASEKLGRLRPRERDAFAYSEKLKEKYRHYPQIARILRHRHVPRAIYHATKELNEIKKSKNKREKNRREHSTPGSVPKHRQNDDVVVREVY